MWINFRVSLLEVKGLHYSGARVMLESIEIIIDVSKENIQVHDLVKNFSANNYDTVEFTVHVENDSLRLRLFNGHLNSVFDGSLAVETFCKRISRILDRRDIPHSVIEHLDKDAFTQSFGTVNGEN